VRPEVKIRESTASGRHVEPTASSRDEALDFAKGVLVVWMVVYHWMNYFVSVVGDIYVYLRPVTPSFLFITGFVVSYGYLHRYSPTDPRLQRRLLQRGAKLLLLFIVLNLAASFVVSETYNGAQLGAEVFVENAFETFVLGRGNAVFDILVPIAYFLLLAPVILGASAVLRLPLILIAGVGLVLATALGIAGRANVLTDFLSMATLGLAVGASALERLQPLLSRPLVLAFVYLLYLAAVTAWNVLFPLQVIGVCLTVIALYLVGLRHCSSNAFGWRQVVELGRYSLFAYVAQIVFLQMLRLALASFDLHGALSLIPLGATVAATCAAVRLTDRARRHSSPVDRAYRLVFA
jgi:peptidoglycan/LPS O-acetylase OafA/YrhL